MAKGQNTDALYRVAKFQIKPTPEQIQVLETVSSSLCSLWNSALKERQDNFELHLAPLYKEIAEVSKTKDTENISAVKAMIKKAYSEHQITLFDQINSLTPKRASDESFATVPRNWQEETLDTLNGSFVSFAKLRQNGDSDARPPKFRSENSFAEISGRYGFKLKEGYLVFSCKKIAGEIELSFKVPQYQIAQLTGGTVKKFTLYADRNGLYWVSLAYQIQSPETKAFDSERAVYIALGTSSIGISSPKGEEVIQLGRADWHWMSKIESVVTRLKQKTSTNPNGGGANVHALTPGSRAWKKRMAAKRKMFGTMSQQQQHSRRNLVARDLIEKEVEGKLLGHGVHFIVSDLVVRSKPGKLADGTKPERGGSHGQNFAAQNTATVGFLVAWLEEKVRESGGSVRKHKLPACAVPQNIGHGVDNKLEMARALRVDFLTKTEG